MKNSTHSAASDSPEKLVAIAWFCRVVCMELAQSLWSADACRAGRVFSASKVRTMSVRLIIAQVKFFIIIPQQFAARIAADRMAIARSLEHVDVESVGWATTAAR